MKTVSLDEFYAPLAVRHDLKQAHSEIWHNLGQPGTWLTAVAKRGIVAEVRAAQECTLCQQRKQALSPYAISGEHDSASELDGVQIDAIHRIVTDPGRLSKRLLTALAEAGMSDAAYVEMLAVIVFTLSIDMFHRAIGAPLLPLPTPTAGAPSQKRPSQLDDIGAWVPVLSTNSTTARQLYRGAPRVSNVARGLSLVPAMTRDQIRLVEAQYVPISDIASMANAGRTISRTQMELVASRVSALNECFY